MSKLKEEGLASTKHHDEIDIESQNEIQDLLVLILEIMKTDKRHPRYTELVKRLPSEYQMKYHYVRAHHMFSWILNYESTNLFSKIFICLLLYEETMEKIAFVC